MKIRGHGNAVSIALSAVAIAVASSGTAYAVTATTVSIADPTTPTNVARVDTAGQLTTIGAAATLNAASYAFVDDGAVAFLGPTNATLGVTGVDYDNAYNRVYPNTDYAVYLYKIAVGAAGTCQDPDRTLTEIRDDAVPQGQSVAQNFPFPVQVRSTGGKKYCIGVAVNSVDSTHGSPYYAVNVVISAVTLSGRYTGAGTGDAAGTTTAPAPHRRT